MTAEHVYVRWIRVGVVAGLGAAVFYPLAVFAPLPRPATVTLAAVLGPLIGFASLGLKALVRVAGDSVLAR